MSDLLKADGTIDLTAVKQHLIQELHAIIGRTDKIQAHLGNSDREMPADWQEAAQLMENDEVLEALEESGRERIEAIRNAMRRLETESYLTCARCGDDINPRRLAAMPTTPVCVGCAGS